MQDSGVDKSSTMDPNQILLEVVGGVNPKGHVFGVGSASFNCYNLSQAFRSSSKRAISQNPQ